MILPQENGIRRTDAIYIVRAMSDNIPVGEQVAWQWMQDEWERIHILKVLIRDRIFSGTV